MLSKFGLKMFVPMSIVASALAVSAFGATAYINQIGYRTNEAKEFTLSDATGSVEIVDKSGKTVLTATPSEAKAWELSGQEKVSLVDFSELKTPGVYSIKMGGEVLRSDLKVSDKTYEEVLKASLKWFYYQRASMKLEETYAGQWKRAAGHTQTNITLHNSAGSGSITSSKGWYDAGDYGRYIVNSGITTYTLLSLFEHYPDYFKTLKWNIPVEGTLPDLLAEIKYNLDWMLTMQDTDGGVFHKLTSLNFPGDDMPAEDNSKLYVIGKGTAAALDFAAVMATAARVYKSFDAAYSAQCLEAAKKAYAWAKENPNKAFRNPSDVQTGEYGDGSFTDEFLFAGTELFLATGDDSYKQNITKADIPSWHTVAGLAAYGAATYGDDENSKKILTAKADELVARTESGFGVVMGKGDFVWGSNAVAANQGIWLLHAYYVSGEEKYYNAARKALDYLLGKNPVNMSFVTGYGTNTPKHPHHRPSTADRVEAPVPGMLVGGPQNDLNSDIGEKTWECSDYRTGYPATTYIDNNCSYATNEVAINWNSPLAYLAGAIEAINAGHKPKVTKADLKPAVGGTDALKPSLATPKGSAQNAVRLRFDNHKLFIEKNGKRFDLKGMRIK